MKKHASTHDHITSPKAREELIQCVLRLQKDISNRQPTLKDYALSLATRGDGESWMTSVLRVALFVFFFLLLTLSVIVSFSCPSCVSDSPFPYSSLVEWFVVFFLGFLLLVWDRKEFQAKKTEESERLLGALKDFEAYLFKKDLEKVDPSSWMLSAPKRSFCDPLIDMVPWHRLVLRLIVRVRRGKQWVYTPLIFCVQGDIVHRESINFKDSSMRWLFSFLQQKRVFSTSTASLSDATPSEYDTNDEYSHADDGMLDGARTPVSQCLFRGRLPHHTPKRISAAFYQESNFVLEVTPLCWLVECIWKERPTENSTHQSVFAEVYSSGEKDILNRQIGSVERKKTVIGRMLTPLFALVLTISLFVGILFVVMFNRSDWFTLLIHTPIVLMLPMLFLGSGWLVRVTDSLAHGCLLASAEELGWINPSLPSSSSSPSISSEHAPKMAPSVSPFQPDTPGMMGMTKRKFPIPSKKGSHDKSAPKTRPRQGSGASVAGFQGSFSSIEDLHGAIPSVPSLNMYHKWLADVKRGSSMDMVSNLESPQHSPQSRHSIPVLQSTLVAETEAPESPDHVHGTRFVDDVESIEADEDEISIDFFDEEDDTGKLVLFSRRRVFASLRFFWHSVRGELHAMGTSSLPSIKHLGSANVVGFLDSSVVLTKPYGVPECIGFVRRGTKWARTKSAFLRCPSEDVVGSISSPRAKGATMIPSVRFSSPEMDSLPTVLPYSDDEASHIHLSPKMRAEYDSDRTQMSSMDSFETASVHAFDDNVGVGGEDGVGIGVGGEVVDDDMDGDDQENVRSVSMLELHRKKSGSESSEDVSVLKECSLVFSESASEDKRENEFSIGFSDENWVEDVDVIKSIGLSCMLQWASPRESEEWDMWEYLLYRIGRSIGFNPEVIDEYDFLMSIDYVDEEQGPRIGKRGWMRCYIVDHEDLGTQMLALGDPSVVLRRCAAFFEGEGIVDFDSVSSVADLRKDILDEIRRNAEDRWQSCLAFAIKPIERKAMRVLRRYSGSPYIELRGRSNHSHKKLHDLLQGMVFNGVVYFGQRQRRSTSLFVDLLHNMGIRFILFSGENERRTKALGAKIGLDTDWNSCISLEDEESAVNLHEADIKAQLPHGVDKILKHVEEVDDVPLLVSLFCDVQPNCVPHIIAMHQSHGDVVCCVGDMASWANTPSFSRSDVAIGVNLYDRKAQNGFRSLQGPQALLASIPCSLVIPNSDVFPIVASLLVQARCLLDSVGEALMFWMEGSLFVIACTFIASLCGLPLLFHGFHALWLCLVVFPILALSIIFTRPNKDVVTEVVMKNDMEVAKIVKRDTKTFLIRFVPSVLMIVIKFIWTLYILLEAGNTSTDCVNGYIHDGSALGDVTQSVESCGGMQSNETERKVWRTSQWIMLWWVSWLLLAHLWSHIHLRHRRMTIALALRHSLSVFVAAVLILFLQTGFSVGMVISTWGSCPSFPWVWYLNIFVFPLILILVHEVSRVYDRRFHDNERKRRFLEFDTRLGMYSPV